MHLNAFLWLALVPLTHLQPATDKPAPASPSPATLIAIPDPAAIPYGMRLPRPVESKLRAATGFPAARKPELVLADLDAIPGRMQEGGDDQSTWRAVHLHNENVQRDRIDLISELEESGYTGPRLAKLLYQKITDIRDVWSRSQFPVDSYERLRQEIIARHKGEPIAIEAQAASMLELIELSSINGLRIHPGDYQKLADIELKRKDAELGGLLILEALATDEDPELRRTWHEWMIQNLGPKSMGWRFVTRERSFSHPIKLEGDGLDGVAIDTTAWAGDVILVDFWGTWCVPCMQAMPELKRLKDKYADKGLRVVGILCDNKLDKAKEWLAEKGFTWPQLVDRTLTRETYDQHRIAVQYAIGGFPTLWIIDRNGVLREEGDRENLEEQVKRFLDEPRPAAK